MNKHDVTNWLCQVLEGINLLMTGETAFAPGKLFMVKKQENRKPPSDNENKCRYTKLCLIIGKL